MNVIMNSCKSCGSYSLFDDVKNGAVVCTECGIVNEDVIIDDTAEWNFGAEEAMFSKDPSRCGGPTNYLLEKSSMSTMISTRCSRNSNVFTMAKIHHQQSMDYIERSLYHVFESIQKMAGDRGNLTPSIIECAKHYYKTISEKRLSRGSIRKGLIACCILYACKSRNVPRSVKEISKITDVSVTVINKTSKIFLEMMSDVIEDDKGLDVDDLISRFCNIFEFTNKEQTKLITDVRAIFEFSSKNELLSGKTPTSITSGIIYYIMNSRGYKIDKKDIAKHHNVSVVTINKIYSILNKADAIKQIQ